MDVKLCSKNQKLKQGKSPDNGSVGVLQEKKNFLERGQIDACFNKKKVGGHVVFEKLSSKYVTYHITEKFVYSYFEEKRH